MVTRVDKEAQIPISIGMEITGLSHVIFLEMICLMFKVVVKIVVENVLKQQGVRILHGQHTMVELVG
jgi:hypothetical protein